MKELPFSVFSILLVCVALTSCTDNSTAQKVQKLEEQTTLLLAQNAELRQQIQKTEEAAGKLATERQTRERCYTLIDRILVKLERLDMQQGHFNLTSPNSELASEEFRLKAIAREQESQSQLLVIELKAQKFQQAETLDFLVRGFFADYLAYITYKSASYQHPDDENRKRASEFKDNYSRRLAEIRDSTQRVNRGLGAEQ